ncbi:MAG: AmmeMemoRadiSam system protein A [Candidatus Rokubacteria bacterium]|nr:AmmeMemoRadiSam system protein A [Candidatus Rokubacteria bacterium]
MDLSGQQALALARQAVEHYVWGWGLLPPPPDPPLLLTVPGAAFVTLRLGRALRGCIGTLGPTKPTLAHEIITNAVAAAASDPRFPPVGVKELSALLYEVDILGALEPIPDEGHLDAEQYGVVVQAGQRRGVLLPAVEGVTSARQQVTIAMAKASIRPDQAVNLYRFTVTRFREVE